MPDAQPLEIVHVPIDDLRPDPANPRRISDHELEALTRSIQEFGLVDPVIARAADRTVIGGHQRLLAARRLGLSTVPVVLLDIDPEKARLLNVALNRISGEFDDELLARLLADLDQGDQDLTLTGFADDELASLDRRERRHRPETFDVDEATEQALRGEPRTRPGDVWRLGEHRLGCAEATDADVVRHLLGDVRPRMSFSDPPYRVAYGDHGGQQRGQRRRRIANDALPPAEWEAFCRGWARNLLAHVDGALYVCMSSKEWPLVSRVLEEAGRHWSDTLIWAKDRFVLGRADYQRQYEAIWYGWREGTERHWCGDRNQGDVWQIPRPAARACTRQ